MSVLAVQPNGLGIIRHDLTGRATVIIQPRAGQLFQPGSAVCHRFGSQLAEIPSSSAPRTDLIPLGRYLGDAQYQASATADGAGGALDVNGNAQTITVMPFSATGTGWFATGTGANQVTALNLDQPCFFYDDDTVYLTNLNGTLSFAGFVQAVDPTTGRVALKSDIQTRCFAELYSPGEGNPGYTVDDNARFVATSIPAGTIVNGVYTASANGAFSTAQDGVTPAVGDKFILPPGTITTLAVTAAQSGLYEMTSLGSATTPMTFQRAASWQNGFKITPGTLVRLGSEGTLFRDTRWYAAPLTATKVVGTDDPRIVPEKVITQITLAAGTYTLATIPIRDASRISVDPALAGGTPAATTTCFDLKQVGGITAGGIGTASLIIEAHSVKGVKVATDVSVIDLCVVQ